VGDIKALLEAAGVDYRDCFEKRELAERLRSARNTLPAGAAARLDALLARSPTSAALAAAAPSSALDELFMDEANTVSLFKRCAPSVVHIRTSAVARAPFSQDATEIPQGAGTGIVWDGDGHIITNFHVIKVRTPPKSPRISALNAPSLRALRLRRAMPGHRRGG
jgi:hypothetical protein